MNNHAWSRGDGANISEKIGMFTQVLYSEPITRNVFFVFILVKR